jgi:hypothetical protein
MCIRAGLFATLSITSHLHVHFSLFSKPGINHFQELALVLVAKDLHHQSRGLQDVMMTCD